MLPRLVHTPDWSLTCFFTLASFRFLLSLTCCWLEFPTFPLLAAIPKYHWTYFSTCPWGLYLVLLPSSGSISLEWSTAVAWETHSPLTPIDLLLSLRHLWIINCPLGHGVGTGLLRASSCLLTTLNSCHDELFSVEVSTRYKPERQFFS